MRIRTVSFAALLLALWLGLTAFTDTDELLSDFAHLDSAFIPPLALTNQEKVQPSKKAMELLMQNWKPFYTEYRINPDDPEWAEDMDSIDQAFEQAQVIVASGENLMRAHEVLETYRTTTAEMRRRNNMDYFIDPLTDFHSSMEGIVHTADEHGVDEIDASLRETLADMLATAKEEWRVIMEFDLNPALFGFSQGQVEKLREFMEKEQQSLHRLDQALESGTAEEVKEAGVGIKPAYQQIYKMFGNFKAVQKT